MADSCVVLSIPRSGTHMIMKMLTMLGLKEYLPQNLENSFDDVWQMPKQDHFCFASHPPTSQISKFKKSGLKAVFISREPKDVITSLYFYIRDKAKKNTSHKKFNKISKEDAINCLIFGEGEEAIYTRYNNRMGWIKVPRVYPTTYEKVLQNPQAEILNIADYLNIRVTDEGVRQMAEALPIGKYDFYPANLRKGIVGDWKNHFSSKNLENFEKIAKKFRYF